MSPSFIASTATLLKTESSHEAQSHCFSAASRCRTARGYPTSGLLSSEPTQGGSLGSVFPISGIFGGASKGSSKFQLVTSFGLFCVEGPQVGDLNLWQAENLKERFYSGKTRALHESLDRR